MEKDIDMKLLVVAQVLDKNHPVLGFFHEWVRRLAGQTEKLIVICLQKGEYDLPENVEVYSLGKEHKQSRVQYVTRLLRYTFQKKHEYDAVFVHMNPEHILVAGFFWKWMGKRVGLWYNHTVASFALRFAVLFVDRVFYTSPYACTSKFKKSMRMPAGIDTDLFHPYPELERIPRSLYFQGRVAPAKKVHILIEAFVILYKKGVARILTIVGPEDPIYVGPLKEKYNELITAGVLGFRGPQKHSDTPKLYATHALSVNLTAAGNYDKTVLESLACGTPVIVASGAFSDIVPSSHRLRHVTPENLAQTIENVFYQSRSDDQYAHIAEHQSLNTLIRKIVEQYE